MPRGFARSPRGYSSATASKCFRPGTEEALRLFERHPSIDVLWTDVVMPGASGPELTRQLLNHRPSLRVVYMSGCTEDAIAQHGVLKPGIVFLNKPFTAETLSKTIQEVLDR